MQIFGTKKTVNKYNSEVNFWKGILVEYEKWYNGEIKLFKENPPRNKQKVKGDLPNHSAILTWNKVHQERKYLNDLMLKSGVFKGKKILDIGSGPHPSGVCFKGANLYCLDPLLPTYLEIGFPIYYYPKVKFIYGHSEQIPFPNNFFDVVISVNAIDHVDDFKKTSREIRRVLKKGGKIRMHIHYHKKTATEPIELNDKVVSSVYSWCKNFRKISESSSKTGFDLEDNGEKYTLWSNFK